MSAARDMLLVVDRARARLDTEHPRVHITARARLYRRVFGVWPRSVSDESFARYLHFKRILSEEKVTLDVERATAP